MNWLSLLIPIAYLGILVGSLATFSHLYRQRKLNAKLRLAPYFPPHTARNVYLSLMHLPDTDPSNHNTKVPDSVLRAALLNRAVEDVMRIMELRTRKGALGQLLQRGVVGDEIWQRLLRAEQELEVELKDVVAEANALAAGWGQSIFQSASEMAQSRLLKAKLDKTRASLEKEKADWDATRERARLELEAELDGEKSVTTTSTDNTDKAVTPAAAGEKHKVTKPPSVVTDDDTVMVETPAGENVVDGGGNSTATTTNNSSTKGKKGKGKK